jgi:hypothetical protein
VGEQTFVPPEYQGQARRAKGDTTSSCADQEGGRTPEANLKACHYVEEFTLWRFRPLGHWEKLAYACLWLTDPSREPVGSKIFILMF